ncbi:MAG: tetratricopeptide repeat protein [Bacteroidales bacterium]|nr:tetratricopeptide repeat protein [Bacteroidales bacterium]MCF8405303.1 tetratricopeptide repeat protein [Bacteroidales bacterium]
MMRKNILYYFVLISLVLGACGSPKNDLQSTIKTMEDSLFADETKMIDQTKARELIKMYVQFADENPESPETPPTLFKAADMSMNLNMPRQAIQLFDRIMDNYPDFEKTPQCLFLKGYVFENDLKDLKTAKEIYEEFLVKFPDDEFADDAEISIKNLGKTPEQLIIEFEEKAKQVGSI